MNLQTILEALADCLPPLQMRPVIINHGTSPLDKIQLELAPLAASGVHGYTPVLCNCDGLIGVERLVVPESVFRSHTHSMDNGVELQQRNWPVD